MSIIEKILLSFSAIAFILLSSNISFAGLVLPILLIALAVFYLFKTQKSLFTLYKSGNIGSYLFASFLDILLVKYFYECYIVSSRLNTLSESVHIDKGFILGLISFILGVLAFSIINILVNAAVDLIKSKEVYGYSPIVKNKYFNAATLSFQGLLILTGAFIMSSLSFAFIYSNGILNCDGGVFQYIGFAMKNGQIPYRDTFDHKGPLIYLLNYIGYIINPRNGIWYMEFIAILFTVLMCFKISNKFCGTLPSVVSVILVMSSLHMYLEGGNLVEEYAMPFIMAAMYIFIVYFFTNNIKPYQLILCGFFGGCVLMLRPNMAVLWLVMPIAVIINEIKLKQPKNITKYAIYFIVGVAVAILPFIIYFAFNGALKDFYYCYIKFNLQYSGEGYVTMGEAVEHFTDSLILYVSALVIIMQVIAKKNLVLNISYLIFLVGNILVISMSGRLYMHYGMILIPAVAYPMALLVSYLPALKYRKNIAASLSVLLLVIILISNTFEKGWQIPTEKAMETICDENTDYQPSLVERSADYVKENTKPDDKILVLGNENKIYTLSERLSASEYSYQVPIIYVDSKIKREFYQEIGENMPEIIVKIEEIPGMDEFIEKHNYKQVNQIENHIFYKKEG